MVTTPCGSVLATAYVRPRAAALLAIASWDAEDRTCALQLDWQRLGLEPRRFLSPFVYPSQAPGDLPLAKTLDVLLYRKSFDEPRPEVVEDVRRQLAAMCVQVALLLLARE